jgi:hypothetical protein
MKSRIAAALILGCGLLTPAVAETPLRINQLQVLGSHNSYRPVSSPDSQSRLGVGARGLDYGHPSLETQLGLGVRQFEFDAHVDREGGRFALKGLKPADSAILRQAGLKVLHDPIVDRETHCLTLRACFEALSNWSRRHPRHELIFVTIDTKEAASATSGVEPSATYQARDLDEIDATARSVFGRKQMITPDDVRGRYQTLRAAVLAKNWPKVAAARGKIMIVLDANPRISGLYRSGRPNLSGRLMFGIYDEDQPEASVFNIQDPVAEESRITRLVRQGFIVRSRSDANTIEARTHSTKRLEAAVRAGAQIISTDYYPGAPDPLELKFSVRLEDGFSQRNLVLDPR